SPFKTDSDHHDCASSTGCPSTKRAFLSMNGETRPIRLHHWRNGCAVLPFPAHGRGAASATCGSPPARSATDPNSYKASRVEGVTRALHAPMRGRPLAFILPLPAAG